MPTLGRLLPSSLTTRLGELRRESVTPYTLPWQWCDAGGLYYGNDGAWLYCSLPLELITAVERDSTRTVHHLLHDLATRAGSRDVHLVSHAWEEPADVPATLPEALQQHLRSALRMFVPQRGLVIGVKLRPAAQGRKSPLGATYDHIDRALGEDVPSFDLYDADRDAVMTVLASWQATPVSGTAAAYLESWYSLGTSMDLDVTERDDVMYVGASTLIETVAVRSFPDDAPLDPRPLFSAGGLGCCVLSIRGRLATKTDHRAGVLEDPTGTLSETSIVIGRRSRDSADTLTEACGALPGMETKPLPLRQVLGLEETLPCSTRRVNPHLDRVTAAQLSRAGLTEPLPAGDPNGLLIGLAAPAFAYPCFINPASGTQVLSASGREGAGKTFLLEHLALQAALAGVPTAYLSGDGESGRPLVAGAHLRPVAALAAGSLDPFLYLPADTAAPMLEDILTAAIPELNSHDQTVLRTGLRRAVALNVTSTAQALALLDDQGVAGRIVRFTAKSQLGRLLSAPAPAPVVFAGSAISVPDALAAVDGAHRPLAEDLLTALALAAAGSGCVILADGLESAASGTSTGRVVSLLQQREVPALLALATRMLPQSGPGAAAQTRIVMCAEDRESAGPALEAAGLSPNAARRQWLADALAVIEDGVVMQPARALIRDRWGRTASLVIGPVPTAALTALTRDEALVYLADAD